MQSNNFASWGINIPTKAYKGESCSFVVQTFTTYAEAVKFASERFGADDKGRINLIDAA